MDGKRSLVQAKGKGPRAGPEKGGSTSFYAMDTNLQAHRRSLLLGWTHEEDVCSLPRASVLGVCFRGTASPSPSPSPSRQLTCNFEGCARLPSMTTLHDLSSLQYPIGKPDRTASVDRSACIAAIRELPAQLQQAYAGLNSSQLDTPYRDGGWTLRQLAHHLADSHMHAFARVKFALTEDWPTIKSYDEKEWARRRKFADLWRALWHSWHGFTHDGQICWRHLPLTSGGAATCTRRAAGPR